MRICVCALLLFFAVSAAWAEERVRIQEVVVTATKIEEPLEDTTSDVTIIRGEDIRKLNVALIPDVFRRLSSLDVVQSGGDGKVTSVFLRGADAKQTLVMIDGIKVNSPTTGGFDFSGLSVDDIERIEIVKGAQSPVYGSEAAGGVINIITKKGDVKFRAEASFEGGSLSTYYPTFAVAGSGKTFNYRVTGTYYQTDGISAAKDGNERDGYSNTSASWKFGYKPSEVFELDLTGRYYYDRSELDGFDFVTGRAADALNFVQHGHHFLLGLVGRLYLTDKWEQVFTLSTFNDRLKFKDPENAFNEADITGSRQVADWQNNFYLSSNFTVTAGLEYKVESGENEGNFDQSVDNTAAYLNVRFKSVTDGLAFNAGLRYDNNEIAGSQMTYRLGASYTIKDAGLTVKAGYGSGFRAPSLNDLFFPFFGNPNLEPETSTSLDITVVKTLFGDRLSLSAAYFRQEYKNLIQSDPRTFTAENIARASIKGFEAEGLLKVVEGLDLKAGYTYLDTEDMNTGLPLNRRPTNKFTFSAAYAAGPLSVIADYIYVGGRYDSARDAREGIKLAPYSLVNLSGTYWFTRNVAVIARIDNLFDADYEEIKSFGTKGATVYGGVRVKL